MKSTISLKDVKQQVRAFRTALDHQAVSPQRFSDEIRRGHAGLPALVKALNSKEEASRFDALIGIGRVFENQGAHKTTVDAVLFHSKNHPEARKGREKHACMFALGRSRAASLMKSFMKVLASEDPALQEVACFVLGYGRWEAATPYVTYLANQNLPSSGAAVWALGQIRSDEALDTLVRMAVGGEQIAWVVPALGEIGDPVALDVLVPMLASPKRDVRIVAASAIWTIVVRRRITNKDKSYDWAVPTLQRATHDAFEPVAVFAALTLANLGEKVDESRARELLKLKAQPKVASHEAFFMLRGMRPN